METWNLIEIFKFKTKALNKRIIKINRSKVLKIRNKI
jgi:hypothetical protein